MKTKTELALEKPVKNNLFNEVVKLGYQGTNRLLDLVNFVSDFGYYASICPMLYYSEKYSVEVYHDRNKAFKRIGELEEKENIYDAYTSYVEYIIHRINKITQINEYDNRR